MEDKISIYHKNILKINNQKKEILSLLGLDKYYYSVVDIEIMPYRWRTITTLYENMDVRLMIDISEEEQRVVMFYYLGKIDMYHIFLDFATRKLFLFTVELRKKGLYKKQDLKKLMSAEMLKKRG